MSHFIKEAMDAGFSREQAKFLDEKLAKIPHDHDIEDIEGLRDELDEIAEGGDGGDDDDQD